jgi:cell volume regulation protein A
MRAWWSAALTERRRQARRSPPHGGHSVWWLLLDELRAGAREALHPAKLSAAAVVAAVTILAFGPFTPGLTLPREARMTLAIALGLAAAAVAHVLLRARPGADPARRGPRLVLAAVALLLSGTVVTGYLLAAVTGSTQAPATEALTADLAVDRTLLVGAVLLTAGVLATAVGVRLRVPGALLFLGLGMLIGDDGLDWISLSDPLLVQSLGVTALVIILFEGGLTTDVGQLRRGAAPGVLLATVGVALTAGVTALGAIWLLDLPGQVAWLVGAIVASTDAAAVFDLLRRAPLSERLAAVLKVESGANDPVAVLLTVGLLEAWGSPTTTVAWLAFGALQLVGGAAVGGAVGWSGAQLLRRVSLGAPGLYPALALGLAGLSYGLAVAVGASGFLATYITGIVLAAEVPRRRMSLRAFHTALAGGVEVGLFLLLGLQVFPAQLSSVALTALGVAAILILVARPLASAVSLLPLGYTLREITAVSWLGMRGAVPVVLATFVASAGIAEASVIFDVVFFVVVVSAVVQGTTAERVIDALDVAAPDAPGEVVAAALPLDGSDIDVLELRLTGASPLLGHELRALATPADVLVVAVVRGEQVLLPRGTTRLCAEDVLVVTTSDPEDGVTTVTRWAGQAPSRRMGADTSA